jgi:hypothetical protein
MSDETEPVTATPWVQRLLDPSRTVVRATRGELRPAWRRVTKGEPRLPVTVAILFAIGLQAALGW